MSGVPIFANGAQTAMIQYLFNQVAPDEEGKPKAGWVTQVKRFFGLAGDKAGNVAAKVGGVFVDTGIKALDTDVAKGVAAINIKHNLNSCERAGQCSMPFDSLLSYKL